MAASTTAQVGDRVALRRLDPHWNPYLVAASIAISLLGAFTSTQLMCQARMSLHFSSVLMWTLLSSLVFGFCSIWCLHEVAMLACELDLPIGIDPGLTILSAFLATSFTFGGLASDLLWDRYQRRQKRKIRRMKRAKRALSPPPKFFRDSARVTDPSSTPLLRVNEEVTELEDEDMERAELSNGYAYVDERTETVDHGASLSQSGNLANHDVTASVQARMSNMHLNRPGMNMSPAPILDDHRGRRHHASIDSADDISSSGDITDSVRDTTDSASDMSVSRRSSSTGSASVLGHMMNLAYRRGTVPAGNLFVATGLALYNGLTMRNITKGFIWSLAITSMHYCGIAALQVPRGFNAKQPFLVIMSALISWIVCLVGCILMPQMETHLGQQCFFSVVATLGVAAMHFTGMAAVTFWSDMPPSSIRGYPPELAIAVASIAIITCIGANALLAHSATVSRNKLAEIVWTRRELWRTIAQKENAEAAAVARSEFIASASHEIRTPLHHLQGYGDLLARTELTEEGRMLLYAIQRATKTLSLITNNVLDWSRLERDAETVCRPVALNMRTVCESIIVLLPNKDDEAEVDVLVAVAPDVPVSLYLDETYLHRILMNLMSNALKFTRSGYILLMIEMRNGKLVATVKDTGCGIPASFIPQMFEPFKQAQTRGSQRGTGLGLSIIKQLLHKMDGTIEAESIHPEPGDNISVKSGSTFTITIPIQSSTSSASISPVAKVIPRVAILQSGISKRQLEGVHIAWDKFGYDVTEIQQISDISDGEYQYIWAETPYLKQHKDDIQQLLNLRATRVLVPYDTSESVRGLSEIVSAPNMYLLPKPLIWHSFEHRVSAQDRASNKSGLPRTVRFASQVELFNGEHMEKLQAISPAEPTTNRQFLILLVEDNPINQKLGKKMLTSLGYEVLLASDGEDAVEQVLKNDLNIDAILMDQSMPRKDGVTATKDIRAMEASGLLSKRRPIIAVTAVVNSEAQAQFREAGADDFLAKPLSLGKLEQTLAGFLSLSKK